MEQRIEPLTPCSEVLYKPDSVNGAYSSIRKYLSILLITLYYLITIPSNFLKKCTLVSGTISGFKMSIY